MSYTQIETVALAPFVPSLLPYSQDYIVKIHRTFARNDHFARLQGGSPQSSEYIPPDQAENFRKLTTKQGAVQYKTYNPASSDADCLAYGAIYYNATMSVRRAYIDSYLDADAALAQLDTLLATGG